MEKVKGGKLYEEEYIYMIKGKLGRKGEVKIKDDEWKEGKWYLNIEK